MIRLRVISKKGEAERILRGNANQIKKLKIDNPCHLLLEILNEEENLKENTIQLYSFERDINKKTYLHKKSFVFEFETTANSVLLYQYMRTLSKMDNISIAKHTKSYYNWEDIPEYDNMAAAINLKKSSYNLKDGGNIYLDI